MIPIATSARCGSLRNEISPNFGFLEDEERSYHEIFHIMLVADSKKRRSLHGSDLEKLHIYIPTAITET